MAGFAQLRGEITDEFGQHFLVGRERVVGEVHADQFALPVELFAAIHVFHVGQMDALHHACTGPEHAHLSHVGGAEVRGADGDDAVHARQKRGAFAERVHRADLDEALQYAFADRAQIHASGKVIQVFERAAFFARL